MNNSDEPTFNETPEETLERLRGKAGVNTGQELLDLMKDLQKKHGPLTKERIDELVEEALEEIRQKRRNEDYERAMKGVE